MSDDTKDSVMDVLRGYGRRNEAALDALAEIQDWRRIARQELERRSTLIVQSLDDDALRAIAEGRLDVPALCRELSAEVSKTS
jgi:hypothetical protein